MRAIIGLVMALAALVSAGVAQAIAADYPTRPVKIVVPFPPGGAVDIIARIVAQHLSEGMGSQFYVENLPGAGGDVGTVAVAGAPPDGYTMIFVAPDIVVSPLVKTKAAFDPIKSFAPVSLVATAQETITVNPSVPAKTMQDLLAVLKAAPKKYAMATPGYGTMGDLEGVRLFALSYGLDVVHVPFQGMAPAVTSTVGGHTAILFAPVALVAPSIKDGSLRPLCCRRRAALIDAAGCSDAPRSRHTQS